MRRTLALVALAWFTVAGYVSVVRHDEKPERADAIVVLAGSRTRLPKALELFHRGYAPLLVVSRGSSSTLEERVCSGLAGPHVICFDPEPNSTVGEARYVGRLAQRRGLGRIDVVTSHFHVYRAQMLIRRCYDGDLRMVGAPQAEWKVPWYMATESAKLVYQLTVSRAC